MKSIEATGKTVSDAIKSGLEILGVDRSDVEIQVIEMGSPGIFGMFGKRAKVRLTVKADDPALDIEMPVLSLDGGAAPKPPKGEKKKAEKPVQPVEIHVPADEIQQSEEDTEDDGEKPARKRRSRNRRRKGSSDRVEATTEETEEAVEAPAPMVEREPFVATPEDQLSETARQAREFLSGLCQRMGVPVTIESMETSEQLRMQMAGENMSLLIGRRGETLDAMQYLTSLTVNRGREDYLRISIDTENYRAKREESLRKLAVRMAGRAKKSGKRVALEPMNPYERRILHSALQNDPEVTTHSEGEEPYRRVIITLNR